MIRTVICGLAGFFAVVWFWVSKHELLLKLNRTLVTLGSSRQSSIWSNARILKETSYVSLRSIVGVCPHKNGVAVRISNAVRTSKIPLHGLVAEDQKW